MGKDKFFNGLFIMIGLVFLGAMIPVSVNRLRSYDRTVDVKGLCEREVKADKVIYPIVYRVMADNIQSIYDQMDANNAVIMAFLKAGGIKESDITVSLPQVSDKLANEYGDNNRVYRYIAKTVITVCTSDVDAVLALMDKEAELMKKGIATGSGNSWENLVEFKYEGLNNIKPEMIEEATQNARETALKFAKDSGSRLGKIKTANQGTFTIESRDGNTPYLKRVRVVTTVTYYLKN